VLIYEFKPATICANIVYLRSKRTGTGYPAIFTKRRSHMHGFLFSSLPVLFLGGVFIWRGGGQDGMQALLPYHLHPTVA
jgi:hypothetical protein